MRFRTIQAGPLMQMPVFLILFIAPVTCRSTLLGGTWHARRRTSQPRATYLLEAGRACIAGEPTHVALAFGLALLLACCSRSGRCGDSAPRRPPADPLLPAESGTQRPAG